MNHILFHNLQPQVLDRNRMELKSLCPYNTTDEIWQFGDRNTLEKLHRHFAVKTMESEVAVFLLCGSAGLGKTHTAEYVSKKYGNKVIKCDATIMKSYHGESEAEVDNLFTECHENSPAVLLIDEADSLFSTRYILRINIHHKQFHFNNLGPLMEMKLTQESRISCCPDCHLRIPLEA